MDFLRKCPDISELMDKVRFEQLTEGQKECLRLFHARWEIKDIARKLERSPVTVNQRLRAARRQLGVARSSEAARLFVEHEARIHSPRIYPPSILVDEQPSPSATVPQPGEGTSHGFPWPFPTRGRSANDLTYTAKLAQTLVLAAIVALIFGGAVAALSALSELF